MALVGRLLRFCFFAGLVAYFVVPILALLLFSLASRWTTTILPDGYTLAHWSGAFGDPRLVSAFGRSFVLAAAAVVLDIFLVVPATYWARVRNPRIRTVIEVAAAIPFALPYVVIAFGILGLYGATPITAQFVNTPALLALAHAAILFPFMYWAVDGAMAAAGVERLSEAAETCGASMPTIIRRIILPNIRPGLVSGSILVFATSFGEFALVQVLIGGNFETVPLWQADALYSATPRFAQLAASSFATFAILFALSSAVSFANRGRVTRIVPAAPVTEQRSE